MTITELLASTDLITDDRMKMAALLDAAGIDLDDNSDSGLLANIVIGQSDDLDEDDWESLTSGFADLRFELIRHQIKVASNLDELFESLVAADTVAGADGVSIAEFADPTYFPVFGGDEITDTDNIYSWDAQRALTTDVNGRLTLIDRKDLDAS